MNTSVDTYFKEGCGRCPLGGTPECKVHRWTAELVLLRKIVRACGLDEESKWGVPCYTLQGKNVLIVTAFKAYCCISFFKGALLKDDKKLLVRQGPNSQTARMLKFTGVEEIKKIEDEIKAYIHQAAAVENAGLKITPKKRLEPIPEELATKFEEDTVLKNAFEALTPGRQRGYILYFSQPKQAKTRASRIEKCTSMILSGIGLHDAYKSRKK